MILPAGFYLRDDVVQISRELLGKVLCTRIRGRLTQVVITETEAYAGVVDKASHAFGGRRTRRTEPLFAAGGIAYVYLCYGIHHLFNVVTGSEGTPHAVLIRAGQPREGLQAMLTRRGKKHPDKTMLAGPGSLAQALGITSKMTGTNLRENRIWIEDHGISVAADAITAGPRIGIAYAKEHAMWPYRFVARIDAEIY